MLPLKTTLQDLDVLTKFLNTQVGWVPIAKIKQTVDSKHGDNRKIEALRRIGLIDRDGSNVKLTTAGREYAKADDSGRAAILQESLRSFPLYKQTLDWMHWTNRTNAPTRTEVANYWHDHHTDLLEKAQGAALTDAVVFFLRLAGAAGLGRYMRPGNNHPIALLELDRDALKAFVDGAAAPTAANDTGGTADDDSDGDADSPIAHTQTSAPPAADPRVQVTTSPAVHINVEIHIAADAKAETIAEIFRNMRKYVLDTPAGDSSD